MSSRSLGGIDAGVDFRYPRATLLNKLSTMMPTAKARPRRTRMAPVRRRIIAPLQRMAPHVDVFAAASLAGSCWQRSDC